MLNHRHFSPNVFIHSKEVVHMTTSNIPVSLYQVKKDYFNCFANVAYMALLDDIYSHDRHHSSLNFSGFLLSNLSQLSSSEEDVMGNNHPLRFVPTRK